MKPKKTSKESCLVCSQGAITKAMIKESQKGKRLVCRYCGAVLVWDWDAEKLKLSGVRYRNIP